MEVESESGVVEDSNESPRELEPKLLKINSCLVLKVRKFRSLCGSFILT